MGLSQYNKHYTKDYKSILLQISIKSGYDIKEKEMKTGERRGWK